MPVAWHPKRMRDLGSPEDEERNKTNLRLMEISIKVASRKNVFSLRQR